MINTQCRSFSSRKIKKNAYSQTWHGSFPVSPLWLCNVMVNSRYVGNRMSICVFQEGKLFGLLFAVSENIHSQLNRNYCVSWLYLMLIAAMCQHTSGWRDLSKHKHRPITEHIHIPGSTGFQTSTNLFLHLKCIKSIYLYNQRSTF